MSDFPVAHIVRADEFNGMLGAYAVKTTDESLSSSTLVHIDSALVLNGLVAGAVYEVSLRVRYQHASATNGGMKVQFSLPPGASLDNMQFRWGGGADGYGAAAVANAAGAVGGITNADPTVHGWYQDGFLVMGSSGGSLGFLWAQNAANANALKVLAGSHLRAVRVL